MSPSEAIDSPVFRMFFFAITGLLGGAGALLAVLRFGLRRDVEHAWRSYRGWLIIVPVVLLAVFLGRIATIVLLALLALVGMKEFARATGLYRDWAMTGNNYAGIVALATV